ncbi:taste receptor type 2 member 40-like [Lithobates pipiens]
MVSQLYIVSILLIMIESSPGIALNLYIVLVNLKGMKSRQKMKPCDLINLTKGLVDIFVQLFLIMQVILVLPWFQKSVEKHVLLISYVSLRTFGILSYLLTAFLCAYYCSAISNLQFFIFVWVKRAITTFLPKLLLLSAMGSFLINIPSIWVTSVTPHEQSMGNSTNNSMIIRGTMFVDRFYKITVDILGIYLPFILTLLSLMVTIFILVRHMWNNKDTNTNFNCHKIQALVNATRTMLLFLVFHVLFYLCGHYAMLSVYDSIDPVSKISWFFVLLRPTVEALIIIQASSKLRERFQVVFCCTETQRG